MTYGCSNQPRPTSETKVLVQSGWKHGIVRDLIKIPFAMSCDCKYDASVSDARCGECQFKKEKQ